MLTIRGIMGTLLALGLVVLSGCNPAKPVADFSIAFSPASLSLAAGGTGKSTLVLTPSGGFDITQAVTEISLVGSIFGQGDTKIQSGEVTKIDETHGSVPFSIGANVPAGSYDMTLNLTIGGLKRPAKITIKVSAATNTVANPTNVTATGTSTSVIQIQWTAVTGATEYLIEEKDGAVFKPLGTTPDSPVDVTDLGPQTSYTFRIKAVKGTSSSSGVEVTGTTL
jgi:hypothetical protein